MIVLVTKEAILLKVITTLIQSILSIALIGLLTLLTMLLVKKTVYLFQLVILETNRFSYYLLVDGILIYFLYFEFIALIVKYFEQNGQFPLRYFIYIGITAIIRFIILNHENALHTLLYAAAIFLLVKTLLLVQSDQFKQE